jgi:predicted DNA-binding antitoxin AbrB/MazE fold protein
MPLTVEAIYENGVLKPAQPLPLLEREKVHLTVHTLADTQVALQAVEQSYGLLAWRGDCETLERIALDDEFSILESP